MFEEICELRVEAVQRADPFALAAALAPLSEQRLSRATLAEAECVVAATQRVINAMSARQAVAVAAFADRAEDDYVRHQEELGQRCAAAASPTSDELSAPEELAAPLANVRICCPDMNQVVAAMLAPVLRVAPRTMVSRVDTARWSGLLPRTDALSWRGDLEPYRVSAVVRVARTVALDDLVEFECRLHHTDVRDVTGSRLKARALRVAQRLSGRTPAACVAESRYVRVEPGDSPGMTRWTAVVPTDRSTAMWAAVRALGQQYLTARPELTPSQADADALTDLVLGNAFVSTTVDLVVPVTASAVAETTGSRSAFGSPVGDGGAAGARPAPELSEVLRLVDDLPENASPLEWETGYRVQHIARVDANPHLQRDGAGRVWFVPGPVTVPSVGSLLPEHVTAILAGADVTLRVAGADPGTGAVSALASRAYRPGRRLARTVRLRDGTCRFPGCGTVADRCQLDHVMPFGDGLTRVDNLQSLCATHHGFKHHAGWGVTTTPDGVCTWTAPTGRTHVTSPHAVHDDAA